MYNRYKQKLGQLNFGYLLEIPELNIVNHYKWVKIKNFSSSRDYEAFIIRTCNATAFFLLELLFSHWIFILG